jgi:hypothetical protein
MEETRFDLETPPYLSLILRSSPPPPPSRAREGVGESKHHQLGSGIVRGFTASQQCIDDDIRFFQKTRDSTLQLLALTQEDIENGNNYSFKLKRKKMPEPAYEDHECRMTKNYPPCFIHSTTSLSTGGGRRIIMSQRAGEQPSKKTKSKSKYY